MLSKRGEYGSAPSHIPGPGGLCTSGDLLSYSFFRSSQVGAFSPAPSLPSSISNSGPESDSAQNIQWSLCSHVSVPQSCAQILVNGAANDLLTNWSRSGSSWFCCSPFLGILISFCPCYQCSLWWSHAQLSHTYQQSFCPGNSVDASEM